MIAVCFSPFRLPSVRIENGACVWVVQILLVAAIFMGWTSVMILPEMSPLTADADAGHQQDPGSDPETTNGVGRGERRVRLARRSVEGAYLAGTRRTRTSRAIAGIP